MEKVMNRIAILVAALIATASCAKVSSAQDQPAPSLQSLLASQYKLSTTGSDSDGFRIIEPGTVLVIKKEGIIATPPASTRGLHFKILPNMCNNTFKNGVLETASKCSHATLGSKFLKSGEKVYITKFEVNEKSNKIVMDVVECDTCNGVTGRSSMKAIIIFDFNDQFLQKAEPGQVTDVINEVLAIQKATASVPSLNEPGSELANFATDAVSHKPNLSHSSRSCGPNNQVSSSPGL